MKTKRKIIKVFVLIIIFAGIPKVTYSNCEAEDNIDIYEAKEIVGDLNEIIS